MNKQLDGLTTLPGMTLDGPEKVGFRVPRVWKDETPGKSGMASLGPLMEDSAIQLGKFGLHADPTTRLEDARDKGLGLLDPILKYIHLPSGGFYP
ncbi:hypothetical protein JX265_000361 [Neoarthrinium moseri]|uniref:Uncharacterized protein n=1 Tax=Neoarthrinium moseri TaxID=1658444 RepID=A0A9Q0AWT2_9PEZI|nr:uncharacterized protein JN550_000611 [Neoarthrinium moseri]KAI1851405.1 hypothetical protein JX266_003480 [Neoarthrinium moseri]KAI1878429.1 hypothetical protein JN550_000611 [Neoarthrinium moseri]KAI1881535.1 hypothetical protein JX265_000361 [Neoarthrinium moseri]